MKLFVHAEIGDWQQRGYHKPWLHFASSLSSDLVGADLDSQSEPVIADWIIKLIDQSSWVFILVEPVSAELPAGVITRVVRHALEKNKLSKIILTAGHLQISSMSESSPGIFIREHKEEKIRELIREFAQ